MTKFVLHADDFGASAHVNRTIIEAIEKGWVRSVSVLATGAGFEDAAAYLRARPDILASVHLNLIEGRPLEPSGDLLVDADGKFCCTFQSLLTASIFGSTVRRQALRGQIQREFEAQARRFAAALQDEKAPIRVDSHGHTHAVPLVADAILTAKFTSAIAYVRVPGEPFFLSLRAQDLRQAIGVNTVKHILLNALGARLRSRLKTAGLSCNAYMIGVLHTRRMSPTSIAAGVNAARRRLVDRSAKNFHGDDFVEILLHPGSASHDEIANWRDEPGMWKFYTSPDRAFEAETAMSARLESILSAES